MSTTNEKSVSVLNDLIELNNDRMEGYNLASEETGQSDLKNLFSEYAQTSSKFKSELAEKVKSMGGEIKKGTSASGKLYRAWMDVKTALSTNDRTTVLKSCEFGEDVAVRGYESALKEISEISAEAGQLINQQYSTIKSHHDTIRNMRDAAIA